MLYHIFYPLSSDYSFLNVFRYITFRSAYSGVTALIFSMLMGGVMIRMLRVFQVGEKIRDDGPQSHVVKSGTPTMGGLLILSTLIISTLLWADLTNSYIWLALFATFGFGLVGFIDDVMKLKKNKGMTARVKLVLQILLGLAVGIYLIYFDPSRSEYATRLYIPFFKEFKPDLGAWYLLLIVVTIVGTSNAVNLTDGLDGLAIGPIIIATITYTLILYLCGHFKFAEYLRIQHIKDVGSLSLGGLLGTIAVIAKHELLLLLVGGIFVIEALSVIIQVAYFKYTGGKRFFKMAPLHHHFEHSGWAEPKVIVRFWIVAVVLAMVSLSTLKLR